MPTLDRVLEFRKEMFEESLGIVADKGADYCREQQEGGDTLFNLRVASILGIVNCPEIGILVRLSDKFARLISLCKDPRRLPRTSESVRDTVRDIHNYIDYLLLLKEEAEEKHSRF